RTGPDRSRRALPGRRGAWPATPPRDPRRGGGCRPGRRACRRPGRSARPTRSSRWSRAGPGRWRAAARSAPACHPARGAALWARAAPLAPSPRAVYERAGPRARRRPRRDEAWRRDARATRRIDGAGVPVYGDAGAGGGPMTDGMAGRVQTVLGAIAAEAMGVALPHEHLLIDFKVMFAEPPTASDKGRAWEPVS